MKKNLILVLSMLAVLLTTGCGAPDPSKAALASSTLNATSTTTQIPISIPTVTPTANIAKGTEVTLVSQTITTVTATEYATGVLSVTNAKLTTTTGTKYDIQPTLTPNVNATTGAITDWTITFKAPVELPTTTGYTLNITLSSLNYDFTAWNITEPTHSGTLGVGGIVTIPEVAANSIYAFYTEVGSTTPDGKWYSKGVYELAGGPTLTLVTMPEQVDTPMGTESQGYRMYVTSGPSTLVIK